MKGLCPFHDEKTPSFQVTPARGFFYCFGCGEGGDVITFLQKIDNLSFAEAVERLADRVGVQLRYTDGGADGGARPEPGVRVRLMEAHQAAAEFYSEQLGSAEAITGRQFLDERGFDRSCRRAVRRGVRAVGRQGAPAAPERTRLPRCGAGGGRSDPGIGLGLLPGPAAVADPRFGRQVVGFGARRLHDDDRMPAKYLNTPETALYKKSHVLYGLDLARQQIGRKSQAVVVEGYTDVMAAHLSGVDTAVASCGTAFGDDHARLLRRLMGNHDAFRGEVIFTFDGDAAGQAAALKVFSGDQNFIAQTYVAVEPTGLDPCDLRLQHGDAAVRELVARRVPLYRFVMAQRAASTTWTAPTVGWRRCAKPRRWWRASGTRAGRRLRPRTVRHARDGHRGGPPRDGPGRVPVAAPNRRSCAGSAEHRGRAGAEPGRSRCRIHTTGCSPPNARPASC